MLLAPDAGFLMLASLMRAVEGSPGSALARSREIRGSPAVAPHCALSIGRNLGSRFSFQKTNFRRCTFFIKVVEKDLFQFKLEIEEDFLG